MSTRPALRVRLGADEDARLRAYCAATGETSTQVVNRLVGSLPDVDAIQDRINRMLSRPPHTLEEVATST